MKNAVYVDVDDTIVRSFGSKRIPITAVIEKIRELSSAGYELYCWSSGGAVYAEESAKEFGIQDCFVSFLPKPHIILDDQAPSKWPTLSILHPNEIDKINAEQNAARRPVPRV